MTRNWRCKHAERFCRYLFLLQNMCDSRVMERPSWLRISAGLFCWQPNQLECLDPVHPSRALSISSSRQTVLIAEFLILPLCPSKSTLPILHIILSLSISSPPWPIRTMSPLPYRNSLNRVINDHLPNVSQLSLYFSSPPYLWKNCAPITITVD
jgi:hypothetical protein